MTTATGTGCARHRWPWVSTPVPDDCWLCVRGLRTLAIRLQQHFAAALRVTAWLGKDQVDLIADLDRAFATMRHHGS